MKRLSDYLKKYRKIIIIAAILVAFVLAAVVMYKSSAKDLFSVSSSTDMSDTEEKLVNILSDIEGVGEAEVMINEGSNGVTGVVIVCQGADSLVTRSNIINAVSVALDVERSNIAIYAMKS